MLEISPNLREGHDVVAGNRAGGASSVGPLPTSGMPVDMSPKTWSIEYQVREDAESMFVPVELLPNAEPGDVVEITSAQPAVSRRGRITGPAVTDPRGDFVTVTFDETTS